MPTGGTIPTARARNRAIITLSPLDTTNDRSLYSIPRVPKNKAALELAKLRHQKTTPEQRKQSASIAGRASGVARRKKKENADSER